MDYRLNELSFTLPGTGWEDSSVHRLRLATPDGAHLALEILRARAVPSAGLAARVDADIAGHGRHLRGFELVERQLFQSSTVHGTSTSFRSLDPEGAVHHEVVYVPLSNVLMVFRAWAPVVHAAACREVIRSAVESLELRSDDAGSPR